MNLNVACLCGVNRYAFSVSNESLPFKPHLCSCNISRQTSGVLLTSYVPVPLKNAAPKLDTLTRYKSSDVLNRYFCSACGTHLFLEYLHDGHFEVSIGSIDVGDGVVEYQGHIWIADTRDGGASDWITQLGDRQATRWLTEPRISAEVPLDWRAEPTTAGHQSESTDEKLHAHCHCGGVEFYITRPNEQSEKATSPFPDLLVPYKSGDPVENLENKPWWLSADRKGYLAGHCACKSCRLSSGFDVVQWAFVPTSNIELTTGEPFTRDAQLGTVRTYESSPGVTRWFCGTCGCNVFWDGAQRPTILDIAVGLLDAESGTKALEWLEWDTGRTSFSEEAHNRELVDGLEAGLLAWGSRRKKDAANSLQSS